MHNYASCSEKVLPLLSSHIEIYQHISLQILFLLNDAWSTFTFAFMHLADAFIQSDLQYIQAIYFLLSVCKSVLSMISYFYQYDLCIYYV